MYSRYIKAGSTTLTKLRKYYLYLFSKNITLRKINVEGAEVRAMESSHDLPPKYNVFIITEFSQHILKIYEISQINFIKLYIGNEYKMPMQGFFS